MQKELDDKLVKTFPNLYADRNKPMTETSMCWGFQCRDGWYNIIWVASEKLEALILKLPENERHYCKASTVKEKFGKLIIYLDHSTEEMDRIISNVEIESERVCETCGKPGMIVGHVYRDGIYATCKDCVKEKHKSYFDPPKDE
jgi:hypothetical protein